jgi:predicted DNA-binding transcriptional regulator AlpA
MTVYLKKAECLNILRVCNATFYTQIKNGLLPAQIKLTGGRASFWLKSEFDAVLNARNSGADNNAIKALVADLHAKRLGVAA